MGDMQYRVVSKGTTDGVVVDRVYVRDPEGRCWGMQDADGDSIPDSCGIEKTNNCDQNGRYKTVKCDQRRKHWFTKMACKSFDDYLAASELPEKWQLKKVTRDNGMTIARYSCGEGCHIDLRDSSSDGWVDEAFLRIHYYSISFVGNMPRPAHEMLQRGILTALDHFVPDTFSETTGEGAWEVGLIAFSKELGFTYNPYKVTESSITFGGKPLSFAPESEPDGDPVATGETAEAPKPATDKKNHMFISESGDEMVDVTDEYSEFEPDNLGVTPLTEGE